MTAQLQPVNLVAPGFRGLNFAQAGSLLPPTFATLASNAIIDSSGRFAARGGWNLDTSVPIAGTPAIETLFEYSKADGAVETILAWNGGISNDPDDPVSGDISGAVTDADGTWWMQNFRDVAIGFQAGQKPIVYTGTGNFATVVESSGTAPTIFNGVGLAAYGRVWGLDADGVTIKYSGLLNETQWHTDDGAGSIDMTSVWTDGTDEVTAIVAFNGSLVVFGKKHIIFWNDGAGGVLGINPEDMYVNDVVAGTGCMTQWSIQPVGETDLLYLSKNGVQSLVRVLESSSNPVRTLTKNIRGNLLNLVSRVNDINTIRSVYDPINGFYLLTFQQQAVPLITATTYVLDQRFPFQDSDTGEILNIITTWTLAPTAWLAKANFTLQLGTTEGIGTYASSITDNGTAFRITYQSPWLELSEEFADYIKILKRMGAILFVKNNTEVLFKWNTDFDESFGVISRTVTGGGDTSAWGIGLWGVSKWAGGLSLRIIKVPSRDKGQYFRIGIEAEVNGQFAIQQLELFTKIGRLA